MKILNFGSLNIDKVYSLREFVCEGETVSAKDFNIFAGGKGLNQSVAAAKAGALVVHVGAVGDEGDSLIQILDEAGVDTSMVKKLEAPTGHAIIQVNKDGQNCIMIYGGTNRMLTKEHINEALSHGESGDIVLLQNEVNHISYIMERASEKGLRIAFNPSPASEELKKLPLDKVEFFILNEIEGATIAGKKKECENLGEILEDMNKKFPEAKIVLTLGDKGVLYQNLEYRASHPIFKVDSVDTTAAGDTFCGYFLAAITQGLSVESCLERASAAAAIAVTKAGAAPSIPTSDVVDRFLEKNKSSRL